MQARRQRGAGGAMPPRFSFLPPRFSLLPPPPDFFLAPSRYFFGRKKLVFLGGKNVKICDFGQKKSSDFGEDLFIFFFWRSPTFGRKICDFGQKKPSDFGEDLFFLNHLLLVGKFVISARKSLLISAKTFAP